MGRSDSPSVPSRRASLPSLGGTTRCARVSLPRPPTRSRGPGVDDPVPLPELSVETDGSPRFLGNPRVPALFSDPGGTGYARPLRRVGAAPAADNDDGSRGEAFGAQSHGLRTRCLRFAARVAPTPRKTRFRLLAKLCRAGLLPAGFHRKVSDAASYISPPFPELRLCNLRPLFVAFVAARENRAGSPGEFLPGSHRSRRAQLRHLARHVTYSLRDGTPSGPRSRAEAGDASGSD